MQPASRHNPIPFARGVTFAAAMLVSGVALAQNSMQHGGAPTDDTQPNELIANEAVVVLPDLPRVAVFNSDGRARRLPVEHVWRWMCNSDTRPVSRDQLTRIAIDCSYSDEVVSHADTRPRAAQVFDKSGTFNIVFDIDANVPAAARDALDRVEAFYEEQFTDPVTIVINIEFDNLPPGVLGATGTPYVHTSWSLSRVGLQDDMDETDVIQNYLPASFKLPVRYNGLTDVATQEDRVFWTIANFRAALGTIGGDAGSMRFNSNISWDYNPNNGVNGFSFVDVVIHEVGHALGFGSGADFRVKDMEALDIFRFQRTDGGSGHDYNPDSYAEFSAASRLVSKNAPNNDANSDIIIAEYKMSDGVPYQASHFREQPAPIGIMDPAMAQGETFRPGFLRTADKRMFDAIGWDR